MRALLLCLALAACAVPSAPDAPRLRDTPIPPGEFDDWECTPILVDSLGVTLPDGSTGWVIEYGLLCTPTFDTLYVRQP